MKNINILFLTLPLFFSCAKDPDASEKAQTAASDKKVIVQNLDSTWTIKTANAEIIADPSAGGRIAALKCGNINFLTEISVNDINWGSTFWPSPQSQWGWPPSAILDKNPYKTELKENSLVMTSEPDTTVGYLFTKEIKPDLQDSSFTVLYKIQNVSKASKSVAPWEITRVAPNGITFYPTGSGEKRGDLAPLMKDSAGVTWFIYDSNTIPDGVPKLWADGSEGWMAQVKDDYIFVKTFPDVAAGKAAPEEAEIEFYANPDRSYIEIEQQGEYVTLEPGQDVEWQVKWYIRTLSDNDKKDLVTTARSIAGK